MKLLEWIFLGLLGNLFCPTMMMIYVCRINAMTFKSFTRTYTIRNRKLAEILIAEETPRGVSTSRDKRNKMSMLGIVSYILFLPQIYFYVYNIWIFITTGDLRWCELEQNYVSIMIIYYLTTLSMKKAESEKYQRGEIW
ncbi:MAG: hypothetical protein NC412_09965 [Roseburia sp.]|nr:hypothetical protein [Roseburia sp.]MCM1278975.1 hypothetical protein [Robinsoniella sp.]